MTSKETLIYLKQLIVELFRAENHRCKEEMIKIRGFLYTRAWVIYSVVLIDKVFQIFSGTAYWQIAYTDKEKDSLEDLNLSFVDQTESIVIVAEISMLVLGVLLSISTYKFRHFAKYQIYHGLIMLLIQVFVPQDVESLKSEICLQTIILYFCNASGTGTEIIACTIVCYMLLMI